MTAKKPPQKPDNLRTYNCDITIFKQKFTILEISPDYEQKNEEYKAGLRKKGIKLTEEELAKLLISDNLIQELVKQLEGDEEKRINYEGRYYQYTYYTYEPVFDQYGKAYRLVWCLTDNQPHVLGVMDCYWRSKYNKNKC